ncbi:VWA domain-containing protein [Nocardioides sp. JQ2195]|uniref:substrate-binding domain-containing protein n=1 Tax=Nocardioides sp. JQ2195 TaxID=2592334 RepID=UPI00143EA050|nr:substrate-binding domain-containing protein [Nocardioides sp. JQ2195]QIX25889.1 VWA domain-containing protein [Nocardioides sp. JQ2195]
MSGGSHALERAPRNRWLLWTGLVVLVLLLAAALVWRGLADDEDPSACATVADARLAASPDIAPALAAAAASLEDQGGCASVDVVAVPSDEVFTRLTTRSGDIPDLWVPDSDVWTQQLAGNGVTAETVVPALATSPVVLAGGPAAEAPASWLAAATSGQLEMLHPLDSTPSALALIALRAEQSKTGASTSDLQAGLVTAAQHYAAQSPGQEADKLLASVTASTKRLIPVSEQEFLAARRDNRSLQATLPETGTIIQKYPLLSLPGHSQESQSAMAELVEFIQRPQGAVALGEHGFRGPDGAALPDRGVGGITELAVPDRAEVEDDLRTWQVLAVPSSMLVVLDASGSMDFATSDGTRMQLAAEAAAKALVTFPDATRIGLWLFSVDQGGPGVDHREMAPLRRLDRTVGDLTQREVLGRRINEALDLTTGGTGLYDTTLAAYRDALRNYDEDYFNAVVLLTDGANDDPGSIDLEELLSTLRSELDSAKPVRVIAIGISEDADMAALKKIAGATGGQAFAARDPRDILTVVSQALLAR